jgi:hypothetical protein
MQPCDVRISNFLPSLLCPFSDCIWRPESDTGESRERHGGPGEGVDQEASVIARKDEPAAADALVLGETAAREMEQLAVRVTVEGAVREREQWKWRWKGLPRSGAPLRAHSGEAGAVGIRREQPKHQDGQVHRDFRP